MKKLWQLSMLAALGVASLSGDVKAGAATAAGALCRPLTSGSYIAGTVSFTNTGSTGITVSCPIPMDNVALGSTVTFRVSANDASTTDGFTCIPYVHNENGTAIDDAGPRTSAFSLTGLITLGGTGSGWTANVPGNVNTNMYAVQCYVPGNFSSINTVRAESP